MAAQLNAVDRLFCRLGWLEADGPCRVHVPILTGIIGFHLLALLACIPWLFSWSGLAWAVAGLYLFGTLGINIGYHRLLTHRGFVCPRWLEQALTILGVCCWQGSPMSWVAIHRMHHQHSDDPTDPHTPKTSFFWGHMGWFLIYDPKIYDLSTYDRYARDLLRDRFHKMLERPRNWQRIHWIHWAFFPVLGAVVGGLWSGTVLGTLQLALSWFVWGVCVRTVAVWHITWSVNSLTHIWGYRNFETRDDSRNNWFVGLLSNGEGWHNNHHAQPRSAAHGMRWWELDVSWMTIWAMERCGLVWNVVRPMKRTPGQPLPEEKAVA